MKKKTNIEVFYPAPLKQLKSGLHLDEIQCKENLVLVQRPDQRSACVTSSTLIELSERGWFSIVSFDDPVYDVPLKHQSEPKITFHDKMIQIDDVSIKMQIADTEPKRVRGLMFQEKLPYDQGMLFVFEQPGLHSLWMLNMQFPLDMIWFDQDGNAVHIEKNVPPCKTVVEVNSCQSIAPNAEATYAIEAASGFVEKYNITKDSKIYLDGNTLHEP